MRTTVEYCFCRVYKVNDAKIVLCGPNKFSTRLTSGCDKLTINVPLFKKLRDIIFFWWENHFMSHFEGHFEGAALGTI
jgi:hypothetical protein